MCRTIVKRSPFKLIIFTIIIMIIITTALPCHVMPRLHILVDHGNQENLKVAQLLVCLICKRVDLLKLKVIIKRTLCALSSHRHHITFVLIRILQVVFFRMQMHTRRWWGMIRQKCIGKYNFLVTCYRIYLTTLLTYLVHLSSQSEKTGRSNSKKDPRGSYRSE